MAVIFESGLRTRSVKIRDLKVRQISAQIFELYEDCPMPHTYKFANAEHTVVERDDGVTFHWLPGTTPGEMGHAVLQGFAGEDYRLDGCPEPAPFRKPRHDIAEQVGVLGADSLLPPAKKRRAKSSAQPVGFMSPLFVKPKKAKGKK
jgi:hypothetical protein